LLLLNFGQGMGVSSDGASVAKQSGLASDFGGRGGLGMSGELTHG
jgi:hypothetical protein